MSSQLEALAMNMGEAVRVAKLDSDEYPELSTELRVQGLPTLIMFSDGKEVHRLEGVPPNKDALRELVRQHLLV